MTVSSMLFSYTRGKVNNWASCQFQVFEAHLPITDTSVFIPAKVGEMVISVWVAPEHLERLDERLNSTLVFSRFI